MISPFVIPEFVDPFALSSVEDCWGDRKLTDVNLMKNWGKLTLKHCRNWQRDFFDYACTEDLTSMEWAKLGAALENFPVRKQKNEQGSLFRDVNIASSRL